MLTKELFEKIENLFLDWDFVVLPMGVEQQLPLWSKNVVEDVRKYFFYFTVYPLSDKGPLEVKTCPYKEKWWKLDKESFKEVGAVDGKISYPRKNYFEIEKMSDIDRLFKSDPTSPKYCQLFKFLDKHYNLHESLRGLMYRTKGIKHYGFDFKFDLAYQFEVNEFNRYALGEDAPAWLSPPTYVSDRCLYLFYIRLEVPFYFLNKYVSIDIYKINIYLYGKS